MDIMVKDLDITVEDLRDLTSFADGEGFNGLKVEERGFIRKLRWENEYTLIFSIGGGYYETKYREAATECQDTCPFEYENDTTMVVTKVFPKEISKTVYIPFKENEK